MREEKRKEEEDEDDDGEGERRSRERGSGSLGLCCFTESECFGAIAFVSQKGPRSSVTRLKIRP